MLSGWSFHTSRITTANEMNETTWPLSAGQQDGPPAECFAGIFSWECFRGILKTLPLQVLNAYNFSVSVIAVSFSCTKWNSFVASSAHRTSEIPVYQVSCLQCSAMMPVYHIKKSGGCSFTILPGKWSRLPSDSPACLYTNKHKFAWYGVWYFIQAMVK